jgi:hypothetical protein
VRGGWPALPGAAARAADGRNVSDRSVWRSEGRSIDEKGWVPLRYWAMWFFGLGLAVATFYVILTPIWIGLRGAAWLAEFRARRRP